MKKKIFTFLFAMIASITSLNAEIIENVQINGMKYNLNTGDKTAELCRTSPTTSEIVTTTEDDVIVTIPSSVTYLDNNYVVTRIGEYAFHEWGEYVTSIVMPSSVTRIG